MAFRCATVENQPHKGCQENWRARGGSPELGQRGVLAHDLDEQSKQERDEKDEACHLRGVDDMERTMAQWP